MPQTPQYYQQQIIAQLQADATLGPLLTSASVFSFFSRIAYAVGYVASIIDNLLTTQQTNISNTLEAELPHQLNWYRTFALGFMYGYTLPQYGDTYDTTGLTTDEITAAQVVKYAAVSENATGAVTLKVATINNGNPAPLSTGSPDELTPFKTYMERVKDAGVWLTYINSTPDLLNLAITVYYDPEVMNADGTLISDGSSPVNEALTTYLQNLNFNGEFITPGCQDAIEGAEGVTVLEITDAQVMPSTADTYEETGVRYLPYSGYFAINNLNITYLPEPNY